MKAKIIFTAAICLWSLSRFSTQTPISGMVNAYAAVTSIINTEKVTVTNSGLFTP